MQGKGSGGSVPSRGVKVEPQVPDAGAGIQYDAGSAVFNGNAGRVASIFLRGAARCGNGTARPPEGDKNLVASALFHGCWTACKWRTNTLNTLPTRI